MQYHSKATDTVCSIKLKREEFLYIRTIFNFQTECVLIYMLLFFYQISAWVFLIHMFLYVGFYCTENTILFVLFLSSSGCLQQKPVSIPSFKGPEDFAAATF